jgi:hypothetical protein
VRSPDITTKKRRVAFERARSRREKNVTIAIEITNPIEATTAHIERAMVAATMPYARMPTTEDKAAKTEYPYQVFVRL